MRSKGLWLVLALIVAVTLFAGCGTEAKKDIVVDNGKGVKMTYSAIDGGSQSASSGKDIGLRVDKDGNIELNYKADTESSTVETNDPSEVIKEAGDAAEGVMTGGLGDMISPPANKQDD